MPHVVNGIGTWYYGKQLDVAHEGWCSGCGVHAPLASYDTRLWFVIFFIPILPLGKKRVIEECPRCQRHYAVPHRQWAQMREQARWARDELARSPGDKNHAIAAMVGFAHCRLHSDFIGLAADVEKTLGGDPEVVRVMAELHVSFWAVGEAERLLRPLVEKGGDDDAREAMARLAMRQGRLDEAESLLGHIWEKGVPDRVNEVYQLAQMHQSSGDHPKALELFDRCEAVNPPFARDETFQLLRRASKAKGGFRDPVSPQQVVDAANRDRQIQRFLRLTPAVLAVLVFAWMAVAWWRGLARPVHLISGLSVPYTVSVAGKVYELAPGSRQEITVAEGVIRIEIVKGWPEKATVEPVTLTSSFWSRPVLREIVILNPDGLAYLERTEIRVRAGMAPGQEKRTGIAYTGSASHLIPGVDHRFEPFPERISISKNGERVLTRLSLVSWDDVIQITPDLAAFSKEIGPGLVARVARRMVELEPMRDTGYRLLGASLEPEEQIALLLPLLALRPLSVPCHLAYQRLRIAGGQRSGTQREYREWLAREPDSPDLQYLAGIMETDPARSEHLLRAATSGARPVPEAVSSLGLRLQAEGRFQESADLLAAALRTGVQDPELPSLQIEALVALGKYDEALEIAKAMRAGNPLAGFTASQFEIMILQQAQRFDSAGALIRKTVQDLRENGLGENVLGPLSASWDASLEYARGRLDLALQIRERTEGSAPSVGLLLMKEAPEEAAKLIADGQGTPEECMTTWLILNMRGAGDHPGAIACLEEAGRRLRAQYVRFDLVADALLGKSALTPVEIAHLPAGAEIKAVALTVLGSRDAANRTLYFDLARRILYRRHYPFHLLKKILDSPSSG